MFKDLKIDFLKRNETFLDESTLHFLELKVVTDTDFFLLKLRVLYSYIVHMMY